MEPSIYLLRRQPVALWKSNGKKWMEIYLEPISNSIWTTGASEYEMMHEITG